VHSFDSDSPLTPVTTSGSERGGGERDERQGDEGDEESSEDDERPPPTKSLSRFDRDGHVAKLTRKPSGRYPAGPARDKPPSSPSRPSTFQQPSHPFKRPKLLTSTGRSDPLSTPSIYHRPASTSTASNPRRAAGAVNHITTNTEKQLPGEREHPGFSKEGSSSKSSLSGMSFKKRKPQVFEDDRSPPAPQVHENGLLAFAKATAASNGPVPAPQTPLHSPVKSSSQSLLRSQSQETPPGARQMQPSQTSRPSSSTSHIPTAPRAHRVGSSTSRNSAINLPKDRFPPTAPRPVLHQPSHVKPGTQRRLDKPGPGSWTEKEALNLSGPRKDRAKQSSDIHSLRDRLLSPLPVQALAIAQESPRFSMLVDMDDDTPLDDLIGGQPRVESLEVEDFISAADDGSDADADAEGETDPESQPQSPKPAVTSTGGIEPASRESQTEVEMLLAASPTVAETITLRPTTPTSSSSYQNPIAHALTNGPSSLLAAHQKEVTTSRAAKDPLESRVRGLESEVKALIRDRSKLLENNEKLEGKCKDLEKELDGMKLGLSALLKDLEERRKGTRENREGISAASMPTVERKLPPPLMAAPSATIHASLHFGEEGEIERQGNRGMGRSRPPIGPKRYMERLYIDPTAHPSTPPQAVPINRQSSNIFDAAELAAVVEESGKEKRKQARSQSDSQASPVAVNSYQTAELQQQKGALPNPDFNLCTNPNISSDLSSRLSVYPYQQAGLVSSRRAKGGRTPFGPRSAQIQWAEREREHDRERNREREREREGDRDHYIHTSNPRSHSHSRWSNSGASNEQMPASPLTAGDSYRPAYERSFLRPPQRNWEQYRGRDRLDWRRGAEREGRTWDEAQRYVSPRQSRERQWGEEGVRWEFNRGRYENREQRHREEDRGWGGARARSSLEAVHAEVNKVEEIEEGEGGEQFRTRKAVQKENGGVVKDDSPDEFVVGKGRIISAPL
jgi:hypothetical protein